MIPPTDEVPIDPLTLPMLQRHCGCEKCKADGVEPRLETFFAFTERLPDGVRCEVHTYFCTRGHGWSTRTKPLTELPKP